MINEILAKIPEYVIRDLNWYVSKANDDDSRRIFSWAIFGICSTLSNLDVISLSENEKLYTYYSNRLYEGGNAQ